MKKTVSVNIKGTNFIIEEDAYELLQDYIDRLTVVLKNEEGSLEIIEDIELRIAEICSSKLNDNKTVIELADIEEILEALGDPSEYVEGEDYSEDSSGSESKQSTFNKTDRRLFRDIDGATLGGVCSGIANYFNIDIVIVRAVFVVLGLFGGFGIPLYLVLWVIIPRAESTIDRLRMKGRPITVETVKEEVEEAAERFKKGSQRFAERVRSDHSYNQRINKGLRVFKSLLGLGLIGLGLIFLVSFLLFFIAGFEFLPVKGNGGFMSITEYGELVLASSSDVKWMWIGGLIASIGGIVFLLSSGIVLLFNLRNKWSKFSLLGLFIASFAGSLICAGMGIRSGRDFAIEKIEPKTISPKEGLKTDQLVIIPISHKDNANSKSRVRRERQLGWFGVEGNNLCKYGIDIEYVESSDSMFHIERELTGLADTGDKARKRARHIQHHTKLVGDTLFIDTKYYFPKSDKLRGQDVRFIVEVPEGKSIKIGKDIVRLGKPGSHHGSQNYYIEEGYIDTYGYYEHSIDY